MRTKKPAIGGQTIGYLTLFVAGCKVRVEQSVTSLTVWLCVLSNDHLVQQTALHMLRKVGHGPCYISISTLY